MGHSTTVCESTTSCPIRVSQPNVSHHRVSNQLKMTVVINVPSTENQKGDSESKDGTVTISKKLWSLNTNSGCFIHYPKKERKKKKNRKGAAA